VRLYVAGATARSRAAVLQARDLCQVRLKGRCDLKVIDIYQQPRLARLHDIFATPTLIVESPRPLRRYLGSLLNAAKIARELGVEPDPNPAP
jgi:circadian clock protein KaiB